MIELGNTVLFMIQLPIGLILGVFLALAMNRKMLGVQTYRILYYLPSVMSIVDKQIEGDGIERGKGDLTEDRPAVCTVDTRRFELIGRDRLQRGCLRLSSSLSPIRAASS